MNLLVADRSDRGKLSVGGEQRAWFLDQILTQSFDPIEAGETRSTAMLTVHGRMIGFMEFVATETALLAHFEPELRPVLPQEISKYLFATRAEVADVTDEYGLIELIGDSWRAAVSDVNGIVHETEWAGAPAGYLWVEQRAVDDALRLLEKKGATHASPAELEAIRIAGGAPRWGREMDTKSFPQEAGVDVRAVHYEKGCYLGQEAMAKIHFRGKVNRRLARLQGNRDLAEGNELMLDGERVGTVTSASGSRGLGLVKHTVQSGTHVHAGNAEIVVT